MSSKLVTVNDVQIQQITYKDKPVVTIAMIAQVHGVSVDRIHKAFMRNKKRFIEGKDYFKLSFSESSELGQNVQVSRNGTYVFPEDGYLLLVKPLNDDVSWEVQRRMRDAYFKAQELAPISPWDLLAQQVALGKQQAERILAIEEEQKRHTLMLVEEQSKRLEQQEKIIEALEASQRAETKSDMAMDESRRFTLEEYVHMNGLLRQFPETHFARYATWLKAFCLEHGLRVDKAPVVGKPWDEEKTYPVQALAAWLRHEQRKPRQMVIPRDAKGCPDSLKQP